MSEIMQATVPAFVFMLDKDDQIYLQRRYQTGYLDGLYEPPCGKTDAGEFPRMAAAREVLEEAGVVIDPADLELFQIYMNTSNGRDWLGLMYRTRKWQGEPSIQEPDKCDDAGFYPMDKTPELTPQVRDAMAKILIAPTIDMAEYDSINMQP